jgi:hypothetical protein
MLPLLTAALLLACEDPVVYKAVPLPEGVISCDSVAYEDRSERLIVPCRRVDGQVSLLWTDLDRLAAYGAWTVDPPWGSDISEITDSDCNTTGECAIATKHFANADTPGAIYAQMVDNPPAPWYQITGTNTKGWVALAASKGAAGIPKPGYLYPWVFVSESGYAYGAVPRGDRTLADWFINLDPSASHPCASYTASGVAHSLDRDSPSWLAVYDTCVQWSAESLPGSWRKSTDMPPGPMHTRNILFDPVTDRWISVTDTLYHSSDNGVTWTGVSRSRFQGLSEPYLVWLVGDGTNLWAMGERADLVWFSRNGGRSFEVFETWIPGDLTVSSAVFVYSSRYDARLAVVIATDHRNDELHVAAMWDPEQ